jgi:hypothetical protein
MIERVKNLTAGCRAAAAAPQYVVFERLEPYSSQAWGLG